ncbi:hypothetical protein SRIMM317S_00605 [Streptomyces rimosus subsp. rimosus]
MGGRIAVGVQPLLQLARRRDEVHTARAAAPGRVQTRVQQALGLADEVEAVGPLVLVRPRGRPRDAGSAIGIVRRQRVREVVPGDQRDQGVQALVRRRGGQLDRAAVRAAEHPHPRVARAVLGDEVDADAVLGRPLPGEEVQDLARRPSVDPRVVQGDRAAGPAEAEAGVGQRDIAAGGEGAGDGVGGAVRLAAAEAVGGHDGGCRVQGVHPGGAVQVGVQIAVTAAGPYRQLQGGDGVTGLPGARRAGRTGGRDRPEEGGARGEAHGGGDGQPRGTGARRAPDGPGRGPGQGTGHAGHADLHNGTPYQAVGNGRLMV